MTGCPDLPISRSELLTAWNANQGSQDGLVQAAHAMAQRRGWSFREVLGEEHLQLMRETGRNDCIEVTDYRGNMRRFRSHWVGLNALGYDRLADAPEEGPPLPPR